MGKLLGIREIVGAGRFPLERVARWQETSLLGANYESVGAVERAYSPYDQTRRGLGQAGETPFDFNDPEATIELKRALLALAQHDGDPLKNPADPILETVWRNMLMTGRYAASWDGPTADEFVTAISRYAPASGISGPYMQLQAGGKGAYGINGGPQPTANGLEVIAGAVQEKLDGTPRMSKYLAWRGGIFAPPSTTSGPPAGAVVLPNRRVGPFWKKDGYTTAWEGGDPGWLATVASLDQSLVACWQQQALLRNEQARLAGLRDCILKARAERDAAVRKANKGAPPATCKTGYEWDAAAAECRKMRGVIELPEVTPSDKACIAIYKDEGKTESEARRLCNVPQESFFARIGTVGALAAGAAIGGGLWWLQSRRKR